MCREMQTFGNVRRHRRRVLFSPGGGGGGGGGGGLGTYTDTGKLGRGWETLQTIHAFVHISIEVT